MSAESNAIQQAAAEFIRDRHLFGAFVGGLLRDVHAAEDHRQRGERDHGESVGVSDEASSPIPIEGGATSQRSLKVQDAPGLKRSFDPVLGIQPTWKSGTFRVSFDIMGQPGADWFFELRDKDGEVAVGPFIRWSKGELVANDAHSTKLASLPAHEWCRLTITATTSKGSYDVTLIRQNGTKNEFKAIPCKPSWSVASYLLFSSLSTAKTAYFIDNISLMPESK